MNENASDSGGDFEVVVVVVGEGVAVVGFCATIGFLFGFRPPLGPGVGRNGSGALLPTVLPHGSVAGRSHRVVFELNLAPSGQHFATCGVPETQ